jgi:hypothetical protein
MGKVKINKRTPEALIAHLRRRKYRIIFYTIATVICAATAIAYGYLTGRFEDMLIVNPEAENIEAETATLTIIGPFMAAKAASCYAKCLAYAIGFGFSLSALIIELTSYTKNQLLVEMWDRIQELESKIDKQTG